MRLNRIRRASHLYKTLTCHLGPHRFQLLLLISAKYDIHRMGRWAVAMGTVSRHSDVFQATARLLLFSPFCFPAASFVYISFPPDATRAWCLFALYRPYLSLVKGQIPQPGVLVSLTILLLSPAPSPAPLLA